MEEWEVSVEAILAGLLWSLGIALVVLNFWVAADLGDLGLLLAGIGAVLTLRRSHLGMFEMQRKAFELGRDYERGQLVKPQSIRR